MPLPEELEELELDEELLLEELLLEDELELDELLLEELVEPVEELELLDDEELELLVELVLELPLIEPAEAVRVTLSRRAPSSRRLIRNVCVPAARLLKVAG